MTNRERVLMKPSLVRVVIKAKITKDSLDNPDPDFEYHAGQALVWWNGIGSGLHDLNFSRVDNRTTEEKIAEQLIARLLTREPWDKILREEAALAGITA